MAQLFMATLLKDALLLAAPFTVYYEYLHSLEGRRVVSAATFGLTLLVNLWGIVTALAGPRIRTVSIKLPRWPAGAPPFRIAQISDLHVGQIIQKPYVEKVVAKVNQLSADAIAITGDLGDAFPDSIRADLAPLGELKSREGTFYVLGNHEYYWNAPAWVKIGRQLGFEVLVNEGKMVGPLWLGGVTDISASGIVAGHRSDPQKALPPSGNPPKVLLAHQPKSVFAAASAGFDLMLSGHTHNGQFFPFNLLVGRFNPYSHGLHEHGALQVYVNVGTGFWGPPLRSFVPAEITLLKLHG
jgi:predicted MPP superfamily phosphohydrolase